jgi:hypothetical protein
VGDTRCRLRQVLAEPPSPTFSVPDSLRTYRNSQFEFELAWQYLPTGGLLLSNDSVTSAMADFARKAAGRATFLDCGAAFGGMAKPY